MNTVPCIQSIPYTMVVFIVLIVFRVERRGGYIEREARSPNGGEGSGGPLDLTTTRTTTTIREVTQHHQETGACCV